ncbi:dihydroorotate oxidase [Lentilactobacillus kisonensis]|uniref:Dihydroorotate dehydrogenase n=2 Tax=Lentilactobacillus kisonensis TaxID=481722 RepID=H1LDP3_9LACO|nr:dihydroorotate oxidase [Lentilactobacillus kisonensis]EHO53076.1 dihydroorotate oxidase [Lentilactobacillus kisonensis F0435]KRL20984.1 dihydroorotate oxidase [Lentilactobacillus kisonensis DSM 19906 = JCM 15041]
MQTNISLASQIGDYQFDNLLLNAAGVRCASTDELDKILDSDAGGCVTKSATPEPRKGNESPRMKATSMGCINSMGLPNHGLDYYLKFAETNQGKSGKQVVLSVAGLSIKQNIEMLKKIQESSFAGLTELNLSCPNIAGKSQVGYDFEAVRDVLTSAFSFFKKPLGLKLPPYFDFNQFDGIAEVLNDFPVTYINSINSIGNGLVVDPDTESVVIKPKGGFGGLGGDYVKPTALANVRALRLRLKPEISIIGTGGIKSGKDVFEHVLCGASLVQIGTAFGFDGTPIFERISKELKEIMAEKGYHTLADFRGKLKTID